MSDTVYEGMEVSACRLWQIELIKKWAEEIEPRTVLEIGHPVSYEKIMQLWGAQVVETVDPYIRCATYTVPIEEFRGPWYDLVSFCGTLGCLPDPMLGIRCAIHHAKEAFVLVAKTQEYFNNKQYGPGLWLPSNEMLDSLGDHFKELTLAESHRHEDGVWAGLFGVQRGR
jgi:hypothetical protein